MNYHYNWNYRKKNDIEDDEIVCKNSCEKSDLLVSQNSPIESELLEPSQSKQLKFEQKEEQKKDQKEVQKEDIIFLEKWEREKAKKRERNEIKKEEEEEEQRKTYEENIIENMNENNQTNWNNHGENQWNESISNDSGEECECHCNHECFETHWDNRGSSYSCCNHCNQREPMQNHTEAYVCYYANTQKTMVANTCFTFDHAQAELNLPLNESKDTILCKETGVYQIFYCVKATNANGAVLQLLQNGNIVQGMTATFGSARSQNTVFGVLSLSEDDTIQLQLAEQSLVLAKDVNVFLSMVKIV